MNDYVADRAASFIIGRDHESLAATDSEFLAVGFFWKTQKTKAHGEKIAPRGYHRNRHWTLSYFVSGALLEA